MASKSFSSLPQPPAPALTRSSGHGVGSSTASLGGGGGAGGGDTATEELLSSLPTEERLNRMLTSPTFSVALYLNTALEDAAAVAAISGTSAVAHGGSGNHEDALTRTMAELALQLQLQTQACHEEIGKISAELHALLPRCYADVARIGKGLEGLQMDITGSTVTPDADDTAAASTPRRSSDHGSDVSEGNAVSGGGGTGLYSLLQSTNGDVSGGTGSSSSSTSSSLETLGTLHALQVNLRRTKEILTAAATWDATLNAVRQSLASQQVAAAVRQWKQLEQGVQALNGMPDLRNNNKNLPDLAEGEDENDDSIDGTATGGGNVDERRAILMQIRTQILQLLQPQLSHALQNMQSRISPLQQCVALYKQLGPASMEKLVQEYVKIRPQQIHKLWFDYRPTIPTSASGNNTMDDTSSGGEQQQQHSFLVWIPNWFDAVLTLLGEERRQSQVIFGPYMVPEITTKVLGECFRPILPSYTNRLENQLCPSNPALTASMNAGGGGGEPPGDGSSSSSSNNTTKPTVPLANVCNAYENTLQFLSLAYESIAGGWLDMVEAGTVVVSSTTATASSPSRTSGGGGSGTTSTASGVSDANDLVIYQKLVSLFLQVTGPFRSYQENLQALEDKYSGMAMDAIHREIQQTVRMVSLPSSTQSPVTDEYGGGEDHNNGDDQSSRLSKAVERLQSERCCNAVFHVAQGVVARFELLNGGYNATKALQTVDQLVSGHATKLASAIPQLIRTAHDDATSTTSSSAMISMDESHIYAALQVLQIAGTFKHDLVSLTNKTRERLGVLSERILTHLNREVEIQEAQEIADANAAGNTDTMNVGLVARATSGSNGKGFVLPESLSAVEIDSIVTKAVCGTMLGGDDAAAAAALLQRLAGGSTDDISGGAANNDATTKSTAPILFPGSEQSAQVLANSCHTFVFDVCSAVPRHHLAGMSSLPVWKERKGITDAFASYGTLPQPYITHVGEHMLALVQALEPFANDGAALEVANRVMDGVRDVALPYWRELVAAATLTSDVRDDTVRTLMDGKAIVDLVDSSAVMEEDIPEEEGAEEDDEAARASEAFCNSWLDVVGLAVTGRLLERIMRIPSLSEKGCEHLNADLTYLVNVLAALGVSGHPHPLLGHVAALATLDASALSESISRRDLTNPLDATLAAIEERMATIRGVAARYNY